MSSGGSAIRGSRVGAGPMGEQDRGVQADRVQVSYYCANGHVFSPYFLASVNPSEIPQEMDCPNCGCPAGRDKENPPHIGRQEPYKSHLAYVKERRSPEEAEALLAEALDNLRTRRAYALAEMERDRAEQRAQKAHTADAEASSAARTTAKKAPSRKSTASHKSR